MHGHTRPVERKIRLWVAQQELHRRKEGERGRIDARGDAPALPHRSKIGHARIEILE
jgi:hypothetical protein